MQARARIAKAQADARVLVTAVLMHGAHMGTIANALTDLTAVATNSQGQTARPFMARIPTPPTGWSSPYAYSPNTAGGTFNISASGDGTTVSMP